MRQRRQADQGDRNCAGPIVTNALNVAPKVDKGSSFRPPRDILKLVVVERHNARDNARRCGFVRGFKLQRGRSGPLWRTTRTMWWRGVSDAKLSPRSAHWRRWAAARAPRKREAAACPPLADAGLVSDRPLQEWSRKFARLKCGGAARLLVPRPLCSRRCLQLSPIPRLKLTIRAWSMR